MTSPIFEAVSDLAILAGIPVTPEQVKEIDRLLFEERIASIRRGVKRGAADDKLGVGGENADRQGETHTQTRPSHSDEQAPSR